MPMPVVMVVTLTLLMMTVLHKNMPEIDNITNPNRQVLPISNRLIRLGVMILLMTLHRPIINVRWT